MAFGFAENQRPWVRSPVALPEFLPFLRPNVSAFFLSTGVLGMDYLIYRKGFRKTLNLILEMKMSIKRDFSRHAKSIKAENFEHFV